MRLNTQKKPGRCLSSVKCACALFPFVLLCTGLASLGAEAKLDPNSILSFVFPDLPDTLMTKSSGEKQSARMSAELPENHSRKGQFPLFIFLTGGGGGHGEAKPSARELVGHRDFICVNLPQFKRDLNTTEPFRGLSISPDDFDLISRAYQTMLQKFEYLNVGMALLGHVIALKAGTHFESLVANRICRPLHMDSTCIALTPELKVRLAMGHDDSGKPSPPWKLQAYSPAGGVHSTANDLLKYVSAHAGLAPSSLTPLMKETHVVRFKDSRGLSGVPGFGVFGRTAMDWVDRGAYQPPGMELLGHAGGAGSYHAWVGFDKKQSRGVVVLTTANDVSSEAIGWTLLQRLPLKRESANEFAKEIVGLGFAFDLDNKTHTILVTRVYPQSPASQAGLSAGLIIQKIENVPTAGKTVAECAVLLRANGSPKVRLELVNQERKETNTVELTRGKFLTSG